VRLAYLVTLNWGNLENREWTFAEMTLLTGESGSGKSTLLDAIQTVLTATRAGVFFYNPGQEETTQGSRTKEKRTLADYCLGREGTHLARTSAHTYLGCYFESSPEEESSSFTAVVAVEAIGVANKAEQARLGLYLVRGKALRIDDYLRDEAQLDGSTHVVEVREFWAHLQRRFGRAGVQYFGDDKGDYLRSLYGTFRNQPHVAEAEALRAARAVVKAMAYKPVGSIDDLVKSELLEEHDLSDDLRKVGDLLRDIRELSEEAARLNRNIEALERAQREGEETLAALAEQLVQEAGAARRSVLRDEEDLTQRRAEIAKELIEQTNANRDAEQIAKRIYSQTQSANALRAKLAQIPAWNERERLVAAIADAERIGSERAQTVVGWLNAVETLVEWARQVDGFMTQALSPELRTAQTAVREAFGSARRLSAPRLATAIGALSEHGFPVEEASALANDVEALVQPAARLFGTLLRDEASFSAACEREAALLDAELVKLRGEDERLAATLRRLDSGRSVIPQGTERVLTALNAWLPHARPQVLAELVETRLNTPWQNAIEGFMGNDRFAIVVEESAEREAIELLRKDYSREGAKIIQGRRAKRDVQHRDIPANSIVEELVIEHPTAAAYMRVAYGNVLKVENTEALRDANRGITVQGHAAAGYGMFISWMPDERLALGHEARARARRAAEGEWREVRKRIEALQSMLRDLRAVAKSLRQLALSDLGSAAHELVSHITGRAEAVTAMLRLDLSEAEELQTALGLIEVEIDALTNEEKKHLGAAWLHQKKAEEAREQADKLERELPDKRAIAANRFARFIVLEESAAHRVQAHDLGRRAEALAADGTVAEQAFSATIQQAYRRAATNYGNFLGTTGQYNAAARESERLALEHQRLRADDFEQAVPWLVTVLAEIERQLRLQRDIGIAQNRERLKEAEGRFNHVFTSDFCFKIHRRVNEGVSALRELNRELEHLTFGTDCFSISWEWVPEYQDYYRFFNTVHSRAEELGQKSLFEQGTLDEELSRVRDTLKSLLLDKNRDVADKRLKELADYRNYRRYEIWRDSPDGGRVALSTWGTGSGGQLETPFYIVRSAVLSSSLRFFTKEGNHLRLMLSDEAFSKMDESRRRSVIRYLRQALGVQLIVAMPTSNSGSVKPEFEKEFTFARVPALLADGREWLACEAQEKILKREALEVRWQAARHEAAARARQDFFTANPQAQSELDLDPSRKIVEGS
jgi:energy-coupling factor transporter ATP-binding protein EcfA2